MSTRALSGLRQGLLLCALVLGVVGMHQLVTADGKANTPTVVMSSAMSMESSVTPADHEMPGGILHDLLHLCLAVLCSLLLAVLLLALARRLVAPLRPAGRSEARAPDRLPPIAGRLLLAQVCVLRE